MSWVADKPDEAAQLAEFLETAEHEAVNGHDTAPMIEAAAVHVD